ncbi:hypothetical protein Gotur_019248 [Gossypium turneri]
MLAIDRIPTKKFLVKRGVNLQNLLISCPWCERVPESASHLFFKCKFIEGFWIKNFNWWEVSWKQVDGFEDFYLLCNNVKMAEIRKSFWLISISAACWTAWLVRNGMVFERRMCMENLIFQSKMRTLLWIRSVYDEVMLQENFWWISPNRCRIDSIKFKPTASFWRPPPHGCLKFNECGMANEDRAGCEGVLRDKEGVVRALFSGSAAANDFDVAEIGAVKVALDVFLALNWKLNDSLYIELGSIVVFFWCANKSLRLWSLQAIFAGIESDIVKAGNVVFSMAEKNGNEMARLQV